MKHTQIYAGSPIDYLKSFRPDRPVLFFSPHILRRQYMAFKDGFPGLVTYAVKANDRTEVLENLSLAGARHFDVASPAEMAKLRKISPEAVVHYNNPIRSRQEIIQGRDFGVKSWSIDCDSELQKLVDLGVKGEVSVRLHLPISGAAYHFGEKFGATPKEAVSLLKKVAQVGFTPAMTFHPGTQCTDIDVWHAYISACHAISQQARVPLARLNVGGGFPSYRQGTALDINDILKKIRQYYFDLFDAPRPELLCEPGRAIVAEAYQLLVRVKAIKNQRALYLNDGIYGGLTEWRDIGPIDRIETVRENGDVLTGSMREFTIFGPTCDSLDCVPHVVSLPSSIQEEDYILIKGVGAYTMATCTHFNGYGVMEHVTLGHGGD